MPKVGTKNCITDIKGIRVGHAQDATLKSGTTVVTSTLGLTASYAIMGGAPGTRDTDLLAPDKTVQSVDAFVLSGGSAFGLDAASGVADRLRRDGQGFQVANLRVPIVPSAILFDLLNGGTKEWDRNPYYSLGTQAYDALGRPFENGSIGAGYGAIAGQLKGGLGTASFVLDSGITVAAIVAANPVGSVVDASGKQFWAAPFERNREFGGRGNTTQSDQGDGFQNTKMGGLIEGANTTIGLVVTDAALTKAQAQRVATAAHDGIARAVVPSHLPHDGDLIFAGSTDQIQLGDTPLHFAEICHFASLCVARAIARAVYHAEQDPKDTVPTWRSLNGD